MEKSLLVILIVIHITLCHKQMRNSKINNEKCQNIKCPPDDKPVCVRVTNKSMKNKKPTNIIMVNECEMEYIKCHQGLSAIIVPMKNCDHSDLKKIQTVMQAKKLKSRRLTLRQAPYYIKTLESQSDEEDQGHTKSGSVDVESQSSNETSKNSDKESPEDDKIPLLESSESTDSSKPEIKMEALEKTSSQTEELKEVSVDTSDDGLATSGLEKGESTSSSENSENNGKQSPGDSDHSQLTEPSESVDHQKAEMKAAASGESSSHNKEFQGTSLATSDEGPAMEATQSEHELSSNTHGGSTGESSGRENGTAPKLSSESSHSETGGTDMGFNNKYDKAHIDYEAICPTSCPIRDVMVCARCQHGIYRTFVSVCHMRMFSCHHINEVLELVSRQPCMLTAPYIMDVEHSQRSQRITEPEDEDNVLTYIMCREKGSADADYAKCNFDEETINTDEESKMTEIDSSVQFT